MNFDGNKEESKSELAKSGRVKEMVMEDELPETPSDANLLQGDAKEFDLSDFA